MAAAVAVAVAGVEAAVVAEADNGVDPIVLHQHLEAVVDRVVPMDQSVGLMFVVEPHPMLEEMEKMDTDYDIDSNHLASRLKL